MGITTTQRLRDGEGWEPTVRLVFRSVPGKGLLLHQLWSHAASGREEWRVVEVEPYAQP